MNKNTAGPAEPIYDSRNAYEPEIATAGVCVHCGENMKFNVPRMGALGGFVHESTGEPLCADNPAIKQRKHSALASLMWQYVDELEVRANHWRVTQDDLHQIALACYVSLSNQAECMANVLEKNYGPREPK